MRQKKGVVSLVGLILVLVVSGLALGCRPCAEAPEVAIPPMDPYLAIWNDGNLDLVDYIDFIFFHQEFNTLRIYISHFPASVDYFCKIMGDIISCKAKFFDMFHE